MFTWRWTGNFVWFVNSKSLNTTLHTWKLNNSYRCVTLCIHCRNWARWMRQAVTTKTRRPWDPIASQKYFAAVRYPGVVSADSPCHCPEVISKNNPEFYFKQNWKWINSPLPKKVHRKHHCSYWPADNGILICTISFINIQPQSLYVHYSFDSQPELKWLWNQVVLGPASCNFSVIPSGLFRRDIRSFFFSFFDSNHKLQMQACRAFPLALWSMPSQTIPRQFAFPLSV